MVFDGFCPDILNDVFPSNTFSNYNIRNRSAFCSRPLNSVYNGTESLSHLTPKMLTLVPNNIKPLDSLWEFKMSLQNLQNLLSTNWLRVIDVVLYFCIFHLLRGVRELCLVSLWGDFPWAGRLQRYLGNSTERLSKLYPRGGLLAGIRWSFCIS